MLGLLQSDTVPLADLGAALQELEPMCAASRRAARSRQDSHPQAQEINDSMAEQIEDGAKFTEIGGQFREVVRGCATTMIAVVGSLETLWTGHLNIWAKETAARGEYPVDEQAAHRADRAHQVDRRYRGR